MSEELIKQNNEVSAAVMNRFLQTGDVKPFNEVDKLKIMHGICERLGVDPVARPLELLEFNGKQVWYLSATGCEMIAAKWNMSFEIVKHEINKDEGLVECIMRGTVPQTGRKDEATAFVQCAKKNLKGEIEQFFGLDMANARMKCETKARRRLIKRLAGLDYIDEDDLKEIQKQTKTETMTSLIDNYQKSIEIKDELYDKTRPEHKRLLAEKCKELGLDPKLENDKQIILLTQDLLIKENIKIDTNFKENVLQAQAVAWTTFYQLKGQEDASENS